MSPLARRLLLVQQHLHTATPEGIGAASYAIGCFRLVTDEFEHVVNLVPVASGPDKPELTLYPANVHTRPLYRRSPAKRVSKARAALQHLASLPRIAAEVARADVVYARWPGYPSFAAALMAVIARKDLMVSIHGNMSEVMLARRGDKPLWRALARALDGYQRMITKRSVVTMVTGEHTRALAGGPAVLFAQHQFEDRHLYRRADTCARMPIELLYVGALSRNKGTDVLLDALASVLAQGLDVRLTLIGTPSGMDMERALVERGLNTDRVRLAGYVSWGEPLFNAYRASDIFVFPSLSEGVPKAPMEALSQSLPVVATPSGTSTYIDHEKSGLLVPPGDADALARAIRRMAEDRALRQACIARGFEVARAHTRDRIQARMRAILEAAFAEREPLIEAEKTAMGVAS